MRAFTRPLCNAARALAAGLVLLPAVAATAPDTATTELAAVWRFDDNLSRSVAGNDIEDAHILRVDIGRHSSAARRGGPDLSVTLGLERIAEFSDLDRVDLGVRSRWMLVDAVGYDRPYLALDAGITGLLHRDSQLRDGAIGELALVSGLRATDRLSLLGGYGFTLRRAREGRVWDSRQHRLFARAELRSGQDARFYASAELGYGDLVANGTPTVELIEASQARDLDPVFGRSAAAAMLPPGGPGPGPGPGPAPGADGLTSRVAYRLDATQYAVGGGWLWQPAPDLGLDLAIRHRWIDADEGLDYEVLELSATLIRRLP